MLPQRIDLPRILARPDPIPREIELVSMKKKPRLEKNKLRSR
jgi:hypothetical protein